jgi:Carbohydrate family 9 binding domain-like
MKAVLVLLLIVLTLGVAQTEVSIAKSTIAVDGDLSDWTTEVTATLDHTMVTDKTDITDDNDMSITAYVTYDDANLYIGANVLDDATVFERGGDQLYQTDALEFWLGMNQYAVAMSEGEPVLHQFSFSGTPGDLSGTQVALEYTDTGYAIEVAIPLTVVSAAVESEVAAGSKIQLAIGGDDTDTAGKADEEAREGQLYYPAGWEWGKPETFAAVTLAE